MGIVKNGKQIIDYSYQNIEYDDYNNTFILKRGSNMGVANIDGKEIIPLEYEQINVKGVYLQAIRFDGTTVYFNAEGKQVEQNQYESVLRTSNKNYFITVDSQGKYGIVNSQGKVLLNHIYRYLEYLYDEYFIAANEEGYLGIVDIKGNTKVEFKYEVLQQVNNANVIEAKILKEDITDLYSAKLDKIYTKKNVFIYSYDQYIEALSQEEVKYFDLQGNALDPIKIFVGRLHSQKKDDKWGIVDENNNVVVDFIYDRTTPSNEYGFAGIQKDGKWGVVDSKGNIIVNPIYKIEETNREPEFIGPYYKVYYGYGESYYTNDVKN